MSILPLMVIGLIFGVPPGKPDNNFVAVDYTKIERRLLKEPKFNAQPRYALFIFDPQAKFRVWAVLDKSKNDLSYYDILFFDKNGDGDLTDPRERFVGTYNKDDKEMIIWAGKLAVPKTNLTHTELKFMTLNRHGYKGIWFSMKWNGDELVSGGYLCGSTDNTNYSLSVKTAPVLRPTILGPLGFIATEKYVLPIGGAKDIQLIVGNPGSGQDTFCAVSEYFLKPGEDRIIATLIAKNTDGKELHLKTEIKRHC